jgi:hypothetical protein
MALLFDAKWLDDAKELYDAKGIMHLAASRCSGGSLPT